MKLTLTALCALAQRVASTGAGGLSLSINGAAAAVGTYPFPGTITSIVFANAAAQFTFGPSGGTILLTSTVLNGMQLSHNLTGASYYVDASGGKQTLVVDTVKIIRVGADVVEAAWIDSKSVPLQHEHHIIMTADTAGLFGYDIMTASAPFSISEVRLNTRWDRCLLNRPFQFERGNDTQQPTYAYLDTQVKVQDETWRVDGVNNAALPCPDDNAGGLPAGYTYTKYDWSLYHHENPFFGHYGHGAGAWFTPLGGITGATSAANYGVGPNHQDLAIHQDGIILNYMGANHYGLPTFPLAKGFRRFYGPWLTFLTSCDPATPGACIAPAAAIAQRFIAESHAGLSMIDEPTWYPPASARSTVTGTVVVADGRTGAGLWVLLSTQALPKPQKLLRQALLAAAAGDGTATAGRLLQPGDFGVYTLHEPTFFVTTAANASFSLPGIAPGTYSLYIFAAGGSITDVFQRDNVVVAAGGGATDLGAVQWAPADGAYSHFLWQVGAVDRSGGEFALGDQPRAWLLPGRVPGSLTFTIGASHEPTDWYYAQTQGGVWTVAFDLAQAPPAGTAHLLVSASLTDGSSPAVAINGDASGIAGAMPAGTDSTLSRQAVRSGFPRLADLTFDAARLRAGRNTVTFTRGAAPGGSNNSGMGWDSIVLAVEPATAPPPAPATLRGRAVLLPPPQAGAAGPWSATWNVTVTNDGPGPAHCARLESFFLAPADACVSAFQPRMAGRDPSRFALPLGYLPPGGSSSLQLQADDDSRLSPLLLSAATDGADVVAVDALLGLSANGGRAWSTSRHALEGAAWRAEDCGSAL